MSTKKLSGLALCFPFSQNRTRGAHALRKGLQVVLILLCVIVAGSAMVSAGTINYPGPFVGTTVEYTDVAEASITGAVFGEPDLIGDALLFRPTEFKASATSPPASSDIEDGQLKLTIEALAGQSIDSIYISEGGAYALASPANTYAQVMASATIFYWITEVDDVAVDPIPGSKQLGPFNLILDGPDNDSAIGIWELEGTLNVAALLGDPTSKVTEVMLSLDNTLVATASGGGTAYIDKKEFLIDVPEPSSMLLLGLGAFALFGWRRHGRS